MILQKLQEKGLISPPNFVVDQCCFLAWVGSISYGCASDNSDMDLLGVCIPYKQMVFPHLAGQIEGFGRQKQRFEQYQKHHVKDIVHKSSGAHEIEYDMTVYGIVRFFTLLMENNPNIVDSIFVPQRCILHCNQVGQIIRENRKEFLHKGCWHKFKGYSYSQMTKMQSQTRIGRRKEEVAEHGFDRKFSLHVVRLLNEVEMILSEGDLDLERNSEQLKSIRRGEWTLEQIKEYFARKESELETLYQTSTLPHSPDEEKIKTILLRCLEEHFGSLDKVLDIPDKEKQCLAEVRQVLEKYGV